jgi:hypothetical protein
VTQLKISGPALYLETVKKYIDDIKGVTKAEEIILKEQTEENIEIHL